MRPGRRHLRFSDKRTLRGPRLGKLALIAYSRCACTVTRYNGVKPVLNDPKNERWTMKSNRFAASLMLQGQLYPNHLAVVAASLKGSERVNAVPVVDACEQARIAYS